MKTHDLYYRKRAGGPAENKERREAGDPWDL